MNEIYSQFSEISEKKTQFGVCMHVVHRPHVGKHPHMQNKIKYILGVILSCIKWQRKISLTLIRRASVL